MKKIIIVIIVQIIGLTSAFAQSGVRYNMTESISWEIRAGVNSATLTGDHESKKTNGVDIAVFLNLPFLNNIYFQTGNMMSLKYKATFIEIPFWVSYQKELGRIFKFNLSSGVNYGFVGRSGWDDFNISFVSSAGFYIKKFYLGVQFDKGLRDVYHVGYAGYEVDMPWLHDTVYRKLEDAKIRSFSVHTGFRF